MVETGAECKMERVWDPLVRLTHWSIAAAVILNTLVVEEESLVHIWIGYGAFALLALRLVWGLIGTEEARFSSFPPSLAAARAHVADMLAGRRHEHRSHNPLGALMIYALWGMLLVVSTTGIMLESAPFPPDERSNLMHQAYEKEDHAENENENDDEEEHEEGEEVVEGIHEAAANLLLLLAAFHVGGVVLESRLSGVNLVRAMVTGVKTRRGGR